MAYYSFIIDLRKSLVPLLLLVLASLILLVCLPVLAPPSSPTLLLKQPIPLIPLLALLVLIILLLQLLLLPLLLLISRLLFLDVSILLSLSPQPPPPMRPYRRRLAAVGWGLYRRRRQLFPADSFASGAYEDQQPTYL